MRSLMRAFSHKGIFSILAASLVFSAVFLPKTTQAYKVGVHEQMTEPLLLSLGFDADSTDEVGDSNYWTDIFEQFAEGTHADNNLLSHSSQRLRHKMEVIQEALCVCNRRGALDALGEALHTVQDVYAHSNTIDNNIAIPDILNMSDGTTPCDPNNNFAPGGLITGYFSVFGYLNWPWEARGQCRGMPAAMCCHYDLNKDETAAPNSAGGNFQKSVNAAVAESKKYIETLESELMEGWCLGEYHSEESGKQFIKMLKRKQRTDIFVIDTTGSMGDDIANMKASANKILDELIAGDEAPTLGLISFKDSVTSHGISCDIEYLRKQINRLGASGGGDCPEASNKALLQAIDLIPSVATDVQLRGGSIILATDASAGNPSLGPLIASRAIWRGIMINTIVTGDCREEEPPSKGDLKIAYGSDNGPTAYIGGVKREATAVSRASSDPLTSTSGRTQYRAIADQTGGVMFLVDRDEVDSVVTTLLEMSAPETDVFFTQRVSLSTGAPQTVDIPVDDSLAETINFIVTASRSGDDIPTVTLIRPDNSTVATDDSDVEVLTLSSVTNFNLDNPSTGTWRLTLDGEGEFAVRAFGATPFRLNSLRLFDPSKTLLHPDIEYMPVEGTPTVGLDVIADVRFTTAPSTVNMMLRREDGTVIEYLDSTSNDESGRKFRTNFIVPNESFTIVVNGKTPSGNSFTRELPVTISPQTVAVSVKEPRTVAARPGTTVSFEVTVTNSSASQATFSISAFDTLDWTVTEPDPVTIPAEGSSTVQVSIDVPLTASPDKENELTIIAEDVDVSSVRNSTSASIVATLLVDIDGSGRVDGFDLAAIGRSFGGTTDDSAISLLTDFNNDEVIDELDIYLLEVLFGSVSIGVTQVEGEGE